MEMAWTGIRPSLRIFGRTLSHRQTPDRTIPSPEMLEAHYIEEKKIALRRNIHSFGCLIRGHEDIQPKRWIFPVEGPRLQ